MTNWLDAPADLRPVPLVFVTTDRRIASVNAAFEALAGIDRARAILGQHANVLAAPASEADPQSLPLRSVFQAAGQSVTIDWRWAEMATDIMAGFVGVGTDIADGGVESHLLATIVHELRQPLQASETALGLMRARPDRELGQRARGVVERQLRYMRGLVEDLQDSVRLQRGIMRLELAPLDLSPLMRDLFETFEAQFTARGVRLVIRAPSIPVVVRGDGLRLRQVLSNLLTNAGKFTPAGGLVDVQLSVADDAVIEVRDTGIGIERELLARVFDVFVRGSEGEVGSGIGLHLVRRLVDLHGGSVMASSEGRGRGAVFTIRLPLSAEREER